MRYGTFITVGAASAALLVMLAGCGGAGTTQRPLQRVEVVAREGPTTPVCQAGSRCDRPFHGRFDLIHDGHRTAIATDKRGRATLDIPPGTYRITTDHAHPLPRLTSAVMAGSSIHAVEGSVALHIHGVDIQVLTLLFDTGIR